MLFIMWLSCWVIALLWSEGNSFVGRYADGFFDDVLQESAWNRVKLFSLNDGNPFRNSGADYGK